MKKIVGTLMLIMLFIGLFLFVMSIVSTAGIKFALSFVSVVLLILLYLGIAVKLIE